MERSPCYDCHEKNYIGGCSAGCRKHEEYQARKAESKKKIEQKKAAQIVLIIGQRKWEKEKRRMK